MEVVMVEGMAEVTAEVMVEVTAVEVTAVEVTAVEVTAVAEVASFKLAEYERDILFYASNKTNVLIKLLCILFICLPMCT
jgi:hypothetical protein